MTNNFPPISAALESKGTRIAVIRRCVALPEALAFSVFVMGYIWRLQSSALNWWLVFPAWLMLSFAFHRDPPKTLGWRADNLWPALRQAFVPFAVFIAAISITGLFLGALQRLPSHLIQPHRFIGYFAFCVLQEVGLQSFLMNRLLAAFGRPFSAALDALAQSRACAAHLYWGRDVVLALRPSKKHHSPGHRSGDSGLVCLVGLPSSLESCHARWSRLLRISFADALIGSPHPIAGLSQADSNSLRLAL